MRDSWLNPGLPKQVLVNVATPMGENKKKTLKPSGFKAFKWSCWADSNCRPHPYQKGIGVFFTFRNDPQSIDITAFSVRSRLVMESAFSSFFITLVVK